MPLALLLASALKTPVMDLRCVLQPEARRMTVHATITLPSARAAKVKQEFVLAQQMSVPTIRILQPKELAGAAEAKAVSTRDKDVTYEIALPKKLEEGKALTLSFDYRSESPQGFVYFLGDKECLAGGYNTCWFPSFGDSRRMEGKLTFQSPPPFIVKASGREVRSAIEGGARISEFAVEQPIVPTFAAAPFVVKKIAGRVPMTLYLLKDRPNAERFTEGCSRILGVLTDLFGPYPFPDFSIIETPSPESSRDLGFSGASFEGFMFADSDSVDAGFNLAYFGHEIGHQWWGNLVGLSGDKGSNIFSEGLAQWGSLQCVKAIEGPAMARQYRLFGYPGYSEEQCLFGSLTFGPLGYDRALLDAPKGYSILFHELANSKGFLVWDTLARTMGRRAFAQGLQEVARTHAWASVTWDQLFATLQKRTKLDLNAFQEQWFRRVGAPLVSTHWSQEGDTLMMRVEQSAPAYRMTMPLVIRYVDGRVTSRDVSLDGATQTLRIPVQGSVLDAALDPDFEVYHATPALRARADALETYTQATYFLPLLDHGDQREKVLRQALEHLPRPDEYGVEFLCRYGLAGTLLAGKRYDEAKRECELALAAPVRDPARLPNLYVRLARIARATGRENEVLGFLDRARAAERAAPRPTGILERIATDFPSHSGK